MSAISLRGDAYSERLQLTRELMWLALPMIGMTISRMLMGFIDFVMVSQLGTAAQAAISPSTLLLFTIACLGMGMAQGVQTFVSQADGRGEPERAGPYVWQTLYVAAAAAILSAPIAYFTPVWFPMIGEAGRHPPDVQEMETTFLRYALWSIGPMTACAGLESFYNGIRKPMIGLCAVLVSLATITIANWVLIFGHLGFPKLGIAGSGIATVLAWSMRLLVGCIPLMWRSIQTRYGTTSGYLPDWRKIVEVSRIGGPVAFQWLIDIGAWLVFMQFMMPPFGRDAMAGANLAIQFMHLSFMPAIGIGMALVTQVGNAIGGGDPNQAIKRVRVARTLIVGYMGLMGLVFVVAGKPIASLLCYEEDPLERASLLTSVAQMLIWVALFQISDAICVCYSSACRGAGDTKVPALYFAYCCWGIFVVGGFAIGYLAPGFGFNGPWAMCTLYIIVLGVLLWRRFHSEEWRKIRIFETDRAESDQGLELSAASVH